MAVRSFRNKICRRTSGQISGPSCIPTPRGQFCIRHQYMLESMLLRGHCYCHVHKVSTLSLNVCVVSNSHIPIYYQVVPHVNVLSSTLPDNKYSMQQSTLTPFLGPIHNLTHCECTLQFFYFSDFTADKVTEKKCAKGKSNSKLKCPCIIMSTRVLLQEPSTDNHGYNWPFLGQ